jgi:hypothetical protein
MPLPLNLPIQVLSKSAHLEPGVFGLFHPILIVAGQLYGT